MSNPAQRRAAGERGSARVPLEFKGAAEADLVVMETKGIE
jgi:hypothetical protein